MITHVGCISLTFSVVNTCFLLDEQSRPNPDTSCTDFQIKKRAMNTFMGEISAGEGPRLTAKSIHPINSIICYVHFLKKNFIESDELEFRIGFKSKQKVLLEADAVPTVPITAKTPSKVQRENKSPGFWRGLCVWPSSHTQIYIYIYIYIFVPTEYLPAE